MIALAEQCMSEYDENGWTGDTWLDPDDVAVFGDGGRARAAE
jgi:4-hydroxyphenylacetate 3-monooxygenase